MGQDELADAVVEREAVDGAALHGHDELCGGAVHCEAGGDELCPGLEDVLLASDVDAVGDLVDGEDCADRHSGVEVGRAVDGVAGDDVAGASGLGEVNLCLFFLGHEHGDFAAGAHGLDEEVVGDDVELLLLVAGGVGGAGQTCQVDEGGATDVVGNGLEGVLESMAKQSV